MSDYECLKCGKSTKNTGVKVMRYCDEWYYGYEALCDSCCDDYGRLFEKWIKRKVII